MSVPGGRDSVLRLPDPILRRWSRFHSTKNESRAEPLDSLKAECMRSMRAPIAYAGKWRGAGGSTILQQINMMLSSIHVWNSNLCSHFLMEPLFFFPSNCSILFIWFFCFLFSTDVFIQFMWEVQNIVCILFVILVFIIMCYPFVYVLFMYIHDFLFLMLFMFICSFVHFLFLFTWIYSPRVNI